MYHNFSSHIYANHTPFSGQKKNKLNVFTFQCDIKIRSVIGRKGSKVNRPCDIDINHGTELKKRRRGHNSSAKTRGNINSLVGIGVPQVHVHREPAIKHSVFDQIHESGLLLHLIKFADASRNDLEHHLPCVF